MCLFLLTNIVNSSLSKKNVVSNSNRFKRMIILKHLKFNVFSLKKLKLNEGYILYLNFMTPDFFKISTLLLKTLNSYFSSLTSLFYFSNVFLQKNIFNTSSKSYCFVFTNAISLFSFIDCLLRLKINFYVKGLFSLEKLSFISIFKLSQYLNYSLLPQNDKTKKNLVLSFCRFNSQFVIKLFLLFKYKNFNLI